MRYDTVIFDLDGTLTNSHDGITNAVCYALSKMNLPIPDEAGLRKYIGPPLVDSFQRYAGMDAAAAERGEDLRQRRQPVLQLAFHKFQRPEQLVQRRLCPLVGQYRRCAEAAAPADDQ